MTLEQMIRSATHGVYVGLTGDLTRARAMRAALEGAQRSMSGERSADAMTTWIGASANGRPGSSSE